MRLLKNSLSAFLFLLIVENGALSFSVAQASPTLDANTSVFFAGPGPLSIGQDILGSTCGAFLDQGIEPPCNPSVLGLESPSNFATSLFFGDAYETAYKNRDLISGGQTLQIVESLMNEPRTLRFQGSTQFWYRAKNISLALIPYHLTYFSMIDNPTYPHVYLEAYQEQSIAAQYGTAVTDQLGLGLRARYVQRKYLFQDFMLFDAVADSKKYLTVQEQKLFFLEPGANYQLNWAWKPLLTAMVSNMGFQDHSETNLPLSPTLDMGFSLNPPLSFGRLSFGFNYRMSGYWTDLNGLRAGMQYSFGVMSLSAAYDNHMTGIAVNSALGNLSAGIAYKRLAILQPSGDYNDANSVYLEFKLLL